MLEVTITSESRYPINRSRLRQKIAELLVTQRLKGPIEVEIMIVGDRKMRALNEKYRQIDQTTDVLSFPLEDAQAQSSFAKSGDGILHLGSVVISYPQALTYAAAESVLVDDKIEELVEHGVLHLLGIHHD